MLTRIPSAQNKDRTESCAQPLQSLDSQSAIQMGSKMGLVPKTLYDSNLEGLQPTNEYGNEPVCCHSTGRNLKCNLHLS